MVNMTTKSFVEKLRGNALEPLVLKLQGRKAPSVVNIQLEGNIISKDPVMINNSFTGTINSGIDFIIGQKGIVKSDLYGMVHVDVEGVLEGDINGARQVIVKGLVNGNITADKLIVKSTGSVTGKVTVKDIIVNGGKLEGSCFIGS